MKLFYCPLEAYKERYTWYMSSVWGRAETHFKNNNVDFVRIDWEAISNTINAWVVLDVYGRNYYAQSQIQNLILKIRDWEVKSWDVIFLEDFRHSWVDALFQIRSMTGIDFKIWTFIHAQSIDDSDFMYSQRERARDIEKWYAKQYDYVFTTSDILQKLYEVWYECYNIYHTWLPYNSDRLVEQLVHEYWHISRKKKKWQVLFSSRFDSEKNPDFFLDVVEELHEEFDFKLVKPRKKLSNDIWVEQRAYDLESEWKLEIVNTEEKNDYYSLLSESDIQFNCAEQDWTSRTLLEAITFWCKPLYPYHKDFPKELWYDQEYLYKHLDLEDCVEKLRKLKDIEFSEKLEAVVERHDKSREQQLFIMWLKN